MSEPLLVQYVVVRRDLIKALNWPLGSVMAQACHASTAALWQTPDNKNVLEYVRDIDNMTKVVMEVKNENQLLKLNTDLTDAKIEHKLWIEQPENIPTAIATAPYMKEEIAHLFKKCSLFR